MYHSFVVGWQSRFIHDMRTSSGFSDANQYFWNLVLRETMISVTLYSAETPHGPLTMIATWSPASGVMRSASHPLAAKVDAVMATSF